jgi:hypothetical protein
VALLPSPEQFKSHHLIGTIMAAPKGNKNSSKENRIWGKTVKKLAVQEDYKRIHKVAEALFRKAEDGDIAAIRELGDRIDGKAEQTISGDSDQPITIVVRTGIDE